MRKLVVGLILGSAFLLAVYGATNILGDKGNFEETLTGKGWALELNGTAQGELLLDSTEGVAKEGKSCGKIVVTEVTTENWHVQLKDPTWVAKKGYKYTFTMWAKADSTRKAQISVYGSKDSKYDYRTSTQITLSTEWQKFSQVFLSDVEGTGILNFAFVCGFEAGTYYIDDVVIEEEEVSTAELYANGDFEAGAAQWNLYVNSSGNGNATMSILEDGAHGGSKFCRIEVTSLPEENWEVQLQDGSWKSKIGCIYTFSFWAKADSERTVHVAAQSGGSRNYEYLLGEDKRLSTEWEEYSFTYYNDSLEGNDSLNFFIYVGASLGKYDFDDISLVIESCDTSNVLSLKGRNIYKPQMAITILSEKLLCKFSNKTPESIKIYDTKGRIFSSYNVSSLEGNIISFKRPPKGMWIVKAKGYSPMKIIIP